MTPPDIPRLVSSINRQLPEINNEALHFILEGYRAADSPGPTDQADDARLLLKRVKSLRNSLHAASTAQPSGRGPDSEVLHLDYVLAETERDLAAALHKLAPARRQPRRSRATPSSRP